MQKRINQFDFITDDVKADWWEVIDGNRQFHTKLIEEFEKPVNRLFL